MSKQYIYIMLFRKLNKGDVFKMDVGGPEYVIVKYYKDNWIKKLLRKININLRYDQYKARQL